MIIHEARKLHLAIRCLIAVCVVLLSLLVRISIKDHGGDIAPYFFLLPVIGISALFLGSFPGSLTAIIGSAATEYAIIHSLHHSSIQPDDLYRPICVILYALLMGWLGKNHADNMINLHKSHRLFESVVDSLPLMVFLKRLPDFKFEVFNRAGEELTGFPRAALLGKNDLDFFPRDQAEAFMKADMNVIQSPARFLDIPEEPIDTAKKGTRILHTVKVAISVENGSPTHLLGISEDITDIREQQKKIAAGKEEAAVLRAQLFHAEKLAAIGTMTATVAHEINNPLAVILGNVDLLVKDPKDLATRLEKIRISTERIRSVVGSLKAFSRKNSETTSPQDLHKVFAEVSALSEVLAKKSYSTLDISYPEKDLRVLAREGHIQQVLLNLVSNACDAVKSSMNKCIRISCSTTEKSVVISVADSGSGIPEEIREKIWEPFFTTKGEAGTGLGLATVRRLVEDMHGRASVESTLGNTVFYVELPRCQ